MLQLHTVTLSLLGGRYISNIEMAGGTIRYVPLQPPKHGAIKTSSAADWSIDMDALETAISSKTRMIVGLFESMTEKCKR